MVANALSWMLIRAQDAGLIKGFWIEETGDYITHAQFADDTNVIVEAKREYIDNTLDIFRIVGEASSLFVKVEGIKAVLISEQPLPIELLSLGWTWEEEDNLSKLLGF